MLPKYASAFIDNRGKERVRLRRTGWQTIYVTASVGTPEFTEAYKQWEKNGQIKVGEPKVRPGSFDDLITRFYRSTEWSDLKASTQETYRGELERFRAKYGDRTAATMTAKHIDTLIGQMKKTPSAANNLRKRLGQLFDFAQRQGMRTDNPARAVKALKTRKGGFPTWQEEQIGMFERHHALGTMPRLAFDLALYTAQRKSDVRLMGPQHVKDGWIKVKQLKTDTTVEIPIHPELAKSIAATQVGHLAYLVSAKGAPFTYDSFGMWFMRQCRAASLDGFSMHGLRKAASRRMAEMGLSNQLIKSITGHKTDSEVSRYTAGADQRKMAEIAGRIMASDGKPDLASDAEGVVNAS
ncbi:integrase [Novosphingobium chloroacetimidivorans]|uniref:Integrase n=1 Tax=Novosphingobium chloroacetimidivorans TaxID=1428314 RepID=A0A7W7K7D2_9SPHN|nr:tyrosine-type recombinase/integrase [Novosphingobium chloroacetimidivorans]MBB4856968.1 integrase [Novosphingobium chloroacetimidivorans]